MKKILTILLCTLLSFGAMASKKSAVITTPASDSRITYVGRTQVSGEDVSFDWTGTTIRIAFQGDDLSVVLSDTGKDYFNVWIDREPDEEADFVARFSGDTTVTLCNRDFLRARYGKKIPAVHTAVLGKRTEGEQGKVTVHSWISSAPLLQAEPIRERLIEFIGGSYTCGFGSENSVATDPFKPETENENKAFGAIVARYFGADAFVIAHSGMGVNRNYNDKLRGYTMADRYLNVFDNGFDKVEGAPLWNPASAPKPDVTVINLGANDFSTGRQPQYPLFRNDYIRILKAVKDFYGEDHPVICISSHVNNYPYIRDAVEAAGLKRVCCYGVGDGTFDPSERGAASHPSYSAHRKLAYCLIPYIATATGWPLTDKEVR